MNKIKEITFKQVALRVLPFYVSMILFMFISDYTYAQSQDEIKEKVKLALSANIGKSLEQEKACPNVTEVIHKTLDQECYHNLETNVKVVIDKKIKQESNCYPTQMQVFLEGKSTIIDVHYYPQYGKYLHIPSGVWYQALPSQPQVNTYKTYNYSPTYSSVPYQSNYGGYSYSSGYFGGGGAYCGPSG